MDFSPADFSADDVLQVLDEQIANDEGFGPAFEMIESHECLADAHRERGEDEMSPRVEAFRALAEAIASGDLTAWNAQDPQVFNSHWRFWAERQCDQEEAFNRQVEEMDAQVQVLEPEAQAAFIQDARATVQRIKSEMRRTPSLGVGIVFCSKPTLAQHFARASTCATLWHYLLLEAKVWCNPFIVLVHPQLTRDKFMLRAICGGVIVGVALCLLAHASFLLFSPLTPRDGQYAQVFIHIMSIGAFIGAAVISSAQNKERRKQNLPEDGSVFLSGCGSAILGLFTLQVLTFVAYFIFSLTR